MTKKHFWMLALLSVAIALSASALVASNMVFKLPYTLQQAVSGVSLSGSNLVALPDNPRTGLATAKNLIDDIGLASVTMVQRFVKSSDTYASYTGRSPQTSTNDFALAAGEGYVVKMKTTTLYKIVGSDNPALSYTLNQAQSGVSQSGTNFYQYNYNQTAGTAKALMDDIGLASVASVQRLLKSNDSYGSYTGRSPQTSANDFTLIPGEAYVIKMKTTTAYTPSHY